VHPTWVGKIGGGFGGGPCIELRKHAGQPRGERGRLLGRKGWLQVSVGSVEEYHRDGRAGRKPKKQMKGRN